MNLLDKASLRQSSKNGLASHLANPPLSLTLNELPEHWFHQIIVVRVKRPTIHDDHLTLLNRIRGAWGDGLKKSASKEAIAGVPCPFDPPCALDVFFREQLRIRGKHGLPKPYVIALDIKRNYLEVRLTIFGIACDWLEAARERLVEALRFHVKWSNQNSRIVGGEIVSVETLTCEAMEITQSVPEIALDFLTPFDATGTDFLMQPSTLVARLARRIDGISRWMGVEIKQEWQELANAWNAVEYGLTDFNATTATRGSRRQGKAFENPVNEGCIILSGELAPIWPLLILGQTCHVGRGATAGHGKYELV